MITNAGGGRKEVTCDMCGDSFIADSFDDALNAMEEYGWTRKMVDGSWENYCPECGG